MAAAATQLLPSSLSASKCVVDRTYKVRCGRRRDQSNTVRKSVCHCKYDGKIVEMSDTVGIELQKKIVCGAASLLLLSQPTYGADLVGEFNASGLVFKDTITVEAFDDPKIDNVEIYVSGHKKSVAEKLSKADFGDTTQTSLTCVATGLPRTKNNEILSTDKSGEEIFAERRNLFTKEIKVRRLFDKENQVVLYVAYATRLKGFDDSPTSAKTSICALPLRNGIVEAKPSDQ